MLLGVLITSFHMGYANLPDVAHSYYDGTERDISQFYDQKLPNIRLGGIYQADHWDQSYVTWGFDTGIHTKKYDTASLKIGYNHVEEIGKNETITFGLSSSISYTSHRPCLDSDNVEYYCMNLTFWSDFEGKENVQVNPEISISYRYRW